MVWKYSDGDSPNSGVECKGVCKITIVMAAKSITQYNYHGNDIHA